MLCCCCCRRFWYRGREGGRALNLGLEITVLSRVSTATATARQTTAAWDEVDVLGGGATPPRVLKFNIVIDPKAYKKWHPGAASLQVLEPHLKTFGSGSGQRGQHAPCTRGLSTFRRVSQSRGVRRNPTGRRKLARESSVTLRWALIYVRVKVENAPCAGQLPLSQFVPREPTLHGSEPEAQKPEAQQE